MLAPVFEPTSEGELMPDISMCMNKDCPLKSQCYRHEASGTRADDWQSYSGFEPNEDGSCDNFWDKRLR